MCRPRSTARARFGMDVRLPGMQYAALRLCPMLGGAPGSVRCRQARLAMPGVERLVMLPAYAGSTAGFAVVAKSYWHARQAVAGGRCRLAAAARVAPLDSRRIERAAGGSGAGPRRVTSSTSRATSQAAEDQAGRSIEAWYRAPYLAHATMEPMNCTAQVRDGKVEVWAPTQVPQMAARHRRAGRRRSAGRRDRACDFAGRRLRTPARGRLCGPGGARGDGLRGRAGAADLVAGRRH